MTNKKAAPALARKDGRNKNIPKTIVHLIRETCKVVALFCVIAAMCALTGLLERLPLWLSLPPLSAIIVLLIAKEAHT